ncbi:unnamed protein product [Hydatigera taeniaeformis]|uniref:DUF4206 domain-containing protein n=1 Tax=Hydatigena taeniaeformis TaxID=6205 RepID=A0A0R3WKA7_HYDTA|nr:unnamed protein product [Hydatigera taeniaeformis]
MATFLPESNILTNVESAHWLCVDCPPYNHEESTIEDQDDQSNSNGDSLSESSWEVLGDGINISVSDDHLSLLARAFPGVMALPHATSVYGGKCALCLSRLFPDDATLDFFDGNFYCSNCHQGQEAVIPRDIIECWDFTPKPVSFATKKFLDSISCHPLIDIGLVNPSLFAWVPELPNVRLLRRTLSLLWSLVSRCSKATSRDLVLALKHRGYMLDNIGTIDSVQDFLDIRSGDLEDHIQAVVTRVALTHVSSCSGCRAWVLSCDICKDVSRPIWPYNLTQFRRCGTPGCRRAMHLDCLLRLKEEKRISLRDSFHTANCLTENKSEITDDPNLANESKLIGNSLLRAGQIELLPRCTACNNNLHVFKIDCPSMT